MNIKRLQLPGTLVLIGALALSTNLFAGETSRDNAFQALDTNGDKMISQQELSVAKKLSKDFSKYDSNNNGKIDKAELTSFLSAESFIPAEEENEPIGAAPTK